MQKNLKEKVRLFKNLAFQFLVPLFHGLIIIMYYQLIIFLRIFNRLFSPLWSVLILPVIFSEYLMVKYYDWKRNREALIITSSILGVIFLIIAYYLFVRWAALSLLSLILLTLSASIGFSLSPLRL